MSDLAFAVVDPGGGRLTDLVSGVSIDLSREQLSWLTSLLICATTAAPSPAMDADDALDAHGEDGSDCIPLSEK